MGGCETEPWRKRKDTLTVMIQDMYVYSSTLRNNTVVLPNLDPGHPPLSHGKQAKYLRVARRTVSAIIGLVQYNGNCQFAGPFGLFYI